MKDVRYQGVLLLRASRLPELVRRLSVAVRGGVHKRVVDYPNNDTFVPERPVVPGGRSAPS